MAFQQIVKFVGRSDVRRLVQTEKNSPYLRLSIMAGVEAGEILCLDTKTEDGHLVSVATPLPMWAVPIWRVDKLTYRDETLGSRILHGVRRYTEDKDSVFYAIDIDTKNEAVLQKDEQPPIYVLGAWRKDSKGYYETETPLVEVKDSDLVATVAESVNRLNKSKPALDQRRETWADSNDKTNYGLYVAQRKADSKFRKANA